MSDATACIYSEDGQVLAWGEYAGTSDCMPSQLWRDAETLSSHWRQAKFVDHEGANPVTCDERTAIVHTCYGSGWEWRGRICLTHMLLTEGAGCYETNLAEEWSKCDKPIPAIARASIIRGAHQGDLRCVNGECGLFHDNACYKRHADPTFAPRRQDVPLRGSEDAPR